MLSKLLIYLTIIPALAFSDNESVSRDKVRFASDQLKKGVGYVELSFIADEVSFDVFGDVDDSFFDRIATSKFYFSAAILSEAERRFLAILENGNWTSEDDFGSMARVRVRVLDAKHSEILLIYVIPRIGVFMVDARWRRLGQSEGNLFARGIAELLLTEAVRAQKSLTRNNTGG